MAISSTSVPSTSCGNRCSRVSSSTSTRGWAAEPSYRFADTETLKLYGPHGAALPPELAGLSPGVHDEVRTPQGLYVALVRAPADGGDVLALDISDIEGRERTLTLTMLVSTAAVAAALAMITHLGVGWLVKPLSSLARAITSLAPNRSGERLTIEVRRRTKRRSSRSR